MTTKRRAVMRRWILLAVVILSGAYVGLFFSEREEPKPGSVPIRIPALIEASGLAASHRDSDLLWSQNDSGGQPVLYGFTLNGEPRGTLRIKGVRNADWEALSSFESDGKAWIAIGDVGDNLSHRPTSVIHVIEEPAIESLSPAQETLVSVAWSIVYRFEDGSHDCEAVVVDPRAGEVWLITKRTHPPAIYHVPLHPGLSTGVTVAKKIGSVAHLPQPNIKQKLFPVPTGRFRGQITDAGLSPDGLSVAILTYGDVLIYHRNPGESWLRVFQSNPVRLHGHGLPQAEAICFSRDGRSVFVTGEQRHPLLLRYPAPSPVLPNPGITDSAEEAASSAR